MLAPPTKIEILKSVKSHETHESHETKIFNCQKPVNDNREIYFHILSNSPNTSEVQMAPAVSKRKSKEEGLIQGKNFFNIADTEEIEWWVDKSKLNNEKSISITSPDLIIQLDFTKRGSWGGQC